MAKNEIERFEVLTIKRSQIKKAEYNPRYIDEGARKRLKKGMKKYGLLEPLIWNQRTGVLVSGHQRLSIIDEMKKYPEKGDYEIQVSAVDLSPAEEREANVSLNNQSMMGDFDFDALKELVNFEGVDVDSLGFAESDLDLIFGADGGKMAGILGDTEEVQNAKGKLAGIKEERGKMNKEKAAENSAAYYFVVVCSDAEERAEMYRQMGVPISEEFVSSEKLALLNRH